ncbi:WD40 repeat domain-containing protein [Actinocorallia populi]|uniref:WD40 repeat domain-containing protein n=1 Tax=Actinocorallia populi TaxID=2079200 RepID=UPI000D088146|nr:WD40 repeat domain-containing protein [Actinocorallia populi]
MVRWENDPAYQAIAQAFMDGDLEAHAGGPLDVRAVMASISQETKDAFDYDHLPWDRFPRGPETRDDVARLRSDDAEMVHQALRGVNGELANGACSVAALAVPFLLRVAANPRGHCRAYALELVAGIVQWAPGPGRCTRESAGDGPTKASGTPPPSQWSRTPVKVGAPLTGHRDAVTGVSFSPDGRMLATGSLDRSVILWDVATGRPKGDPLRMDERVDAVAFSPDGQALAVGTAAGVVVFDEPLNGPSARPLPGADSSVRSVAFAPDGGLLAATGLDGKLWLWDAVAGGLSGDPLDAMKSPSEVRFSPDGSVLAIAGGELFRLVDTASRRDLLRLDTGVLSMSVAFGPDGRTLALPGADKVRILNVPDGRELRSLESDGPSALAFSPGGRTLAVTGINGYLSLWDTATGSPVADPADVGFGLLLDVAFSPDGNRLAVAGTGGRVQLWQP